MSFNFNTDSRLFVMRNPFVACHACSARQMLELIRPRTLKVPMTVKGLRETKGLDVDKPKNSWRSFMLMVHHYCPELVRKCKFHVIRKTNYIGRLKNGFTIVEKRGKTLHWKQLRRVRGAFLQRKGRVINGVSLSHGVCIRRHEGKYYLFDDDKKTILKDNRAWQLMQKEGFVFLI